MIIEPRWLHLHVQLLLVQLLPIKSVSHTLASPRPSSLHSSLWPPRFCSENKDYVKTYKKKTTTKIKIEGQKKKNKIAFNTKT